MIAICDNRSQNLDFDWPKNVHEDLMHVIEFIIKSMNL